MDWIRRNWPDLLIGIALIAVIAGIVATLLSGGSLLPFGQRQTQTPALTSPTSPTVNGSSPLPSTNGQTATSAGQAASGGAVIPVAPGAAAMSGAGAAAGANTPTASTAASGGAAGTPASAVTVPVGAPSYRISVAAVHNAASAQQLADKLKAAGYPAFVGQQGDLSLVLVGPFGDQGQADTTASELKGDGYDTLIYTYEGGTAATPTTATSGGSTVTAAVSAPPAPATQPQAGGTYLQVGAYATLDSAQPQIQRLQQLGYTVSQRQEGNLIKLLVGPFGAGDLSAAEARLKAQGIDSFPRH